MRRICFKRKRDWDSKSGLGRVCETKKVKRAAKKEVIESVGE